MFQMNPYISLANFMYIVMSKVLTFTREDTQVRRRKQGEDVPTVSR